MILERNHQRPEHQHVHQHARQRAPQICSLPLSWILGDQAAEEEMEGCADHVREIAIQTQTAMAGCGATFETHINRFQGVCKAGLVMYVVETTAIIRYHHPC